jgi:hypothetical protein
VNWTHGDYILGNVRLAGAGGPAWQHHIADLWRKCGTFRTHAIWWAADFAPVLRTVAAGPACGSGRDDTATMRR